MIAPKPYAHDWSFHTPLAFNYNGIGIASWLATWYFAWLETARTTWCLLGSFFVIICFVCVSVVHLFIYLFVLFGSQLAQSIADSVSFELIQIDGGRRRLLARGAAPSNRVAAVIYI